MSGIQSLLAIGAVWLFALVTINFNTTVVHNISIEVENKVYLTAFSLADDMIEEIKQKAFDQNTTSGNVPTPENLSIVLGPEAGEIWPQFNDVDDYNGHDTTVSFPYVESYHISTRVDYVLENNPEQESGGIRTFYKKVEVEVESPYMTLPVTLSFIFTMK